MDVFLNSFTPLAFNKMGRGAANKNNLPLYIDGSCRREPDFENPKPAITQLCRPKKLINRLRNGDLIIYITRLGKYGTNEAHWKLISILEVINILPDHNSTLTFYTKHELPISQNIICNKTEPYSLDYTHGITEHNQPNINHAEVIKKWNLGYMLRARQYPEVAITQIWNNVLYLNNPPIIDHLTMRSIFGRIPSTQTPPRLTEIEWNNFKKEMKL
jgi:hypothetical protein